MRQSNNSATTSQNSTVNILPPKHRKERFFNYLFRIVQKPFPNTRSLPKVVGYLKIEGMAYHSPDAMPWQSAYAYDVDFMVYEDGQGNTADVKLLVDTFFPADLKAEIEKETLTHIKSLF